MHLTTQVCHSKKKHLWTGRNESGDELGREIERQSTARGFVKEPPAFGFRNVGRV